MSLSNYPPGVSGNEYEISGPDWEQETTRYCDLCRQERDVTVYGHQRQAWWTCPVCDMDWDEDEPYIDPDDYHDRTREEQS